MAKARPAEGELGSMTRSVAERVIYEANLGAEDTKIARMYYIERLPQIEIAEEMQMDRKEEEHETHEHHLTMDDARRWAEKMKNADGSSGPHWTIAQTEQVKRENGMRCNAAEFFAVMNAIYSDFCVALKECGISEHNTDCYAKLAHAWINDQDAEEGKAKRYLEFIVK